MVGAAVVAQEQSGPAVPGGLTPAASKTLDAQVMLDRARKKAGSRIALAQADATDFDAETLFGVAQFDRVFISYALSMIPDWQAALRAAASSLIPRAYSPNSVRSRWGIASTCRCSSSSV